MTHYTSNRPDINRIVGLLEELDFQNHRSEVLRLRQELQELDADYFASYMDYRAQRPAALEILSSDQVYHRDG